MKKIMMATIVVAISVVSGWNISQNKSMIVLSDVALANVEALADETLPPYPYGYTILSRKMEVGDDGSPILTVVCTSGMLPFCI